MTPEHVGGRLAEILRSLGIDALFGVPGGQTLPLYQATRARGLQHVLMRDERNAACAADGYARVTGTVGVCDATVGPGITNLVSGLAEALASSVPVLAIVADIRADQGHLRRRAVVSQAVDQGAVLASVTKWVARVDRTSALDATVDQALRVATTGRPGPVALEIPEDLWLEAVTVRRPFGPADARAPRHRSAPEPDAVRAAAALLQGAARPVVLAGGGAVGADAGHELRALVDELGIPVVTTINGKGLVDEGHPLAGGVVGLFGDVRALRLLDDADVVLVVGSKLDQFSTHRWRVPHAGQAVIHLDVDGEEIGRTGPVAVALVGDALVGVAALRAELSAARAPLAPAAVSGTAWPPSLARPEPAATTDGLHPAHVLRHLDGHVAADDVVVCDASYASGWGATHLRRARPRRFLAPRGLAGIGWSAGAALGARVAAPPGGRVHVVAGDGAWAYGVGELETAARLALDITYVILDNASFGWIVHGEDRLSMSERSTFGPVDYAAVARGFGAAGHRATTLEELDAALADAARTAGPVVVDVTTSPTVSPIVSLREARSLPPRAELVPGGGR